MASTRSGSRFISQVAFAAERLQVGRASGRSSRPVVPSRRSRQHNHDLRDAARPWLIRDGAIACDSEPNEFRRTVRPFLRGFKLPYNVAITYRLESITAGETVLVRSSGTRDAWIRAPAD